MVKKTRKLDKKYDVEFDIEIGDSKIKRTLGYNYGQNPYIAAKEFIDREELHPNFLDTIAKYIMNEVGEEKLNRVTVEKKK